MSTQATKELASLQQQVREQQSTIADLRARLARVEALSIRKARRE
jgi:predicted  nucleic acid-binding Zn-ribbon protein